MPSWVAFNPNGNILVGKRAYAKQNWVYDAKRMIGQKIDAPSIQEYYFKWPFQIENGERDRCMVKLEGIDKRISPEEISAKLLNAMQQIAKNRLQREVTKAVVTVPAYFNQSQK